MGYLSHMYRAAGEGAGEGGYSPPKAAPTLGEMGSYASSGQATPQAGLGMATTQPTGQTSPGTPAADASNNGWVNIGGVNMPVFSRNDWEWKDYEYTPGGYAEGAGISGDGNATNEVYKAGGWLLTQAARDRLRAGGWDLNSPNNMAFNFSGHKGEASPDWTGHYRFSGSGGDDGIRFDKAATDADYEALKNTDPMSLLRNAMYKQGDKWGQAVQYQRVGDQLIPVNAGEHGWDSNLENRNRNKTIGKVAATVLSAGAAAPAMAAGMAAGGGILGSGLSLAQIGTAAGFLNTMSGGRIPGLSELGMVTGLAGGIGGLADGLSNGVNSAGEAFDLAKTGYNVYNKGSQLMDTFNGGQARPPMTYSGGAQDTRAYLPGQEPGGGAGGFDWSQIPGMIFGGAGGGNTGLLDIYGAYKGSKEARDEAFRLQNLYNDAQARRQPVLDRLNASYIDPNTFYDSNQWKGLSSVYQNSLDRGAAKSGRMANPTDREVALQNYGMKELENYRQGLRQQAQLLNPDAYLNPFMRGSTREANAANPYFAMGGRGGVGGPGLGGAAGTLQKLAQAFGGFDKIPSYLRSMFSTGPGANPNHGGTFEENYPTTGPEGGFDPGYDPYGNLEDVGSPPINLGSFDYSGAGWDMPGDWGGNQWDDMSWVDDFEFDF